MIAEVPYLTLMIFFMPIFLFSSQSSCSTPNNNSLVPQISTAASENLRDYSENSNNSSINNATSIMISDYGDNIRQVIVTIYLTLDADDFYGTSLTEYQQQVYKDCVVTALGVNETQYSYVASAVSLIDKNIMDMKCTISYPLKSYSSNLLSNIKRELLAFDFNSVLKDEDDINNGTMNNAMMSYNTSVLSCEAFAGLSTFAPTISWTPNSYIPVQDDGFNGTLIAIVLCSVFGPVLILVLLIIALHRYRTWFEIATLSEYVDAEALVETFRRDTHFVDESGISQCESGVIGCEEAASPVVVATCIEDDSSATLINASRELCKLVMYKEDGLLNINEYRTLKNAICTASTPAQAAEILVGFERIVSALIQDTISDEQFEQNKRHFIASFAETSP